jgi:hypothetical protein
MRTIKTISTLMLAASLGAAMILLSRAALARNNDHQEHSDHQDSSGTRSDNSNRSTTHSGKDSGDTNKTKKSKPGPAGTVTWGGTPPRSPPPAGKGLHIRGGTTSRTPVSLKEPIANSAPIHGGSPPRSPVATANPTPAGAPAGAAVVSNGQVRLYIPNSPSGLSVTSDEPGTITVSNGDPSHSVTLPGGSVTISGGGVNAVGAAPGIQVVSHPNGDFVAAANAPVPPAPHITGGPEGGFLNALGNGLVDTGKGIVGTLDPEIEFKGTVAPSDVVKQPTTSTMIQR